MKKEPLIAVIAGIALGVILALLVLHFTSPKVEVKETPKQNESITSLLTPNVDEELFSLVSPLDGEEIASNSALFTINVKKASLILVQGTNSEKVLSASKDGVLSFEVPLKNGLNQLQISALRKGQTSSKDIRLYSNDK